MPTKQHLYNGLARPADYSMYGNVLAHLRTSPCWHRNRLVRPAGLRSVPELFVGSFSITRPNLTHQLSDPIKPNLIQLTAKLSAVNVNHIWTHKHNFHNHKVKTSWKDSSGWKLTIRGRVGLGRDFAVFDGLGWIGKTLWLSVDHRRLRPVGQLVSSDGNRQKARAFYQMDQRGHTYPKGKTTGHEPWWGQLPTEPRYDRFLDTASSCRVKNRRNWVPASSDEGLW